MLSKYDVAKGLALLFLSFSFFSFVPYYFVFMAIAVNLFLFFLKISNDFIFDKKINWIEGIDLVILSGYLVAVLISPYAFVSNIVFSLFTFFDFIKKIPFICKAHDESSDLYRLQNKIEKNKIFFVFQFALSFFVFVFSTFQFIPLNFLFSKIVLPSIFSFAVFASVILKTCYLIDREKNKTPESTPTKQSISPKNLSDSVLKEDPKKMPIPQFDTNDFEEVDVSSEKKPKNTST